jgi:hypothetical protein
MLQRTKAHLLPRHDTAPSTTPRPRSPPSPRRTVSTRAAAASHHPQRLGVTSTPPLQRPLQAGTPPRCLSVRRREAGGGGKGPGRPGPARSWRSVSPDLRAASRPTPCCPSPPGAAGPIRPSHPRRAGRAGSPGKGRGGRAEPSKSDGSCYRPLVIGGSLLLVLATISKSENIAYIHAVRWARKEG